MVVSFLGYVAIAANLTISSFPGPTLMTVNGGTNTSANFRQ